MQTKPALLLGKLALASARLCQKAFSFSVSIGRASFVRSEKNAIEAFNYHSQQAANAQSEALSQAALSSLTFAQSNSCTITPLTLSSLSCELASQLQQENSAKAPLYSEITIYDHDEYAHKSLWSFGAAFSVCMALVLSLASANSAIAAPNNQSGAKVNDANAFSDQYLIGGSQLLQNGPSLEVERKLLLTHEEMVKHYADNYVSMMQKKQPANKTERCIITADALDRVLKPNSMVFWEGSCTDGKADGFGRAYVVTSGRIVFEMLTNLHADDPLYNTIYYIKNTELESSTQYFFGRSVRIQSSGLIINHTKLNNDLTVGMQMSDKANLITYQKDTSLKEPYILNIKDYGNYAHFVHDLSETPYPTLSMSYRLLDRRSGYNVGHHFTGRKSGVISGKFNDENGRERNSVIPSDVIERVKEITDEVDINVENTLTDVIDSMKVFNAYKDAVCDPHFDNSLCKKMRCKDICDLKNYITPDDSRVKEMLVRLVKNHNSRPLYAYLSSAKNADGSESQGALAVAPGVVDKDPTIVANSISGYTSGNTTQPSSTPDNLDFLPAKKPAANQAAQEGRLHNNLYPRELTQEQIQAKARDAQAVADAYQAAEQQASNEAINKRLEAIFGPDDSASNTTAGKTDPAGVDERIKTGTDTINTAEPNFRNNEFGYGDDDNYHPENTPPVVVNHSTRANEKPLYQAKGPSLAPRSYDAPDANYKERERLKDAHQSIDPKLNQHDQEFMDQQNELIEQQRLEHQREIEAAKARAIEQLKHDLERREAILETSNNRTSEEEQNLPVDFSSDK